MSNYPPGMTRRDLEYLGADPTCTETCPNCKQKVEAIINPDTAQSGWWGYTRDLYCPECGHCWRDEDVDGER